MTSLPEQGVAPCPLCERTKLVKRLEWPQAPEILYYQCAACGHVWSPEQETPPLQVLNVRAARTRPVSVQLDGLPAPLTVGR